MKARKQALEAVGGLGRDRLRLLVARIAAGEPCGVVGDDRHRGAAQARAARQDHLGRGRHADEIGAEDPGGADLGRGLEARPGEPHVDALVELDVARSRRFVQLAEQRLVIGLGQRHEPVMAEVADQRVGSGKVDVIGDRDQSRRRPFLVEAAGGVGEQERLAAEPLERVDRNPHRIGVAALVIMAAALEERDPPALDRADHEAPGVALDSGYRKAGDVEIGDRGRVARLVGEGAEARAEHDGERRERIEAAGLERGDCGVCCHAGFRVNSPPRGRQA